MTKILFEHKMYWNSICIHYKITVAMHNFIVKHKVFGILYNVAHG